MIESLIITLGITLGQLIKLPLGLGGVSFLDISIVFLNILGIYRIQFKFKKLPQFINVFLFFLFVCIVSLIFSPLHLKFDEYLNASFYFVRLYFYILFIFLVYLKAFPNFLNNLEKTLIYSGVILAILGLLQFIFLPDLGFLAKFGWDPHYFRTVSTFLDPNFAGAYFVLTLILIFHLPNNRFKNLFFVFTFAALLTTFSRSSYLMFLTSGLALSFLEKSKKILISTIGLFLILLAGFQLYTQIISTPRHIDREQSASFRINTWQQGRQLFQNHPILGIGFNAYKYALKEYGLGDEQFLKSHGASSNDSSLLFVGATTGIVGLIIYLWFLISILKMGFKSNFTQAASIVGLLIHSIFANSLFFPPIFLWLMLIPVIPKK